MKLYNTLTRTIQEFQPLDGKTVRMYVCGPTVYDVPHIGHARSAYIFDVLRRYLEYKGFSVQFVRNVTDVDDKIIHKARETGESTEAVAAQYLARYHETMDRLGIGRPTQEPLATGHIDEMLNLISQLVLNGSAYETNTGDVYFAVRKFPGYGKLSNRTVDELQVGTRVEPGEQKQDPLDFALWKSAKPDEPSWSSPWGKGRPGWHIECSAMSTKYLGDEFDIHGGGVDLVFPHHENEVAQAQAAGKKFARFWIHNGLLTVNGEKMSKSLGNFVTVEDVLTRHDVDVLKVFFLSTHYRSPADFSWGKIAAAKNSLARFDAFLSRMRLLSGPSLEVESVTSLGLEIERFRQDFERALDDDLNTPAALSVLYEFASYGLQMVPRTTNLQLRTLVLRSLQATFLKLARVLGLLGSPEMTPDERIQQLIRQRDEARQRGDFKSADRIRSELESEGIILEDTEQGTVWRQKR